MSDTVFENRPLVVQTEHHSDIPLTNTANTAADRPSASISGGVAGAGLLLAALLSACGGGGGGDSAPGTQSGNAKLFVDLSKAPLRTDLVGGAGTAKKSAMFAATSATAARAARVPTASEFMDWAESTYPAAFPGHKADIVYTADPEYAGLLYRFYPGTGNYIAVWRSICFFYGPVSGGKFVSVGNLLDLADAITSLQQIQSPGSANDAARFLLHAQFSASEAEIADVQQQGYSGWLQAQFNLPLGQSGWDWMVSKGYSAIDTQEYFFRTFPAFFMIWNQLMAGSDAVRKRWALALSEMFVVSIDGASNINWNCFGTAGYWDTLCQNAFGNFRTLLEQLTLNPSMGAFLNSLGNSKEDPATGRLPDENYAREVMQLFTIGLYQLNLDGTPKLGANGQPMETYQQSDVTNLARVFTGYTLDYKGFGQFQSPVSPHPTVSNFGYIKGLMILNANQHSNLEANFLGTTIPANTPAPIALKNALDTLFNHPNVGPFFAKQMIQRLVTSNPNPAYVARVASVFNDNGMGIRGDLKAVLRAILLDREALSPAGLLDPTFGKLREPMLRFVQWARTFKAKSLKDTWKIYLWNGDPRTFIDQNPLNPPSVFNFFRPGYVPPSTVMAVSGATAPEFQLVNDTSVAAWINFLQSFVYSGYYVHAPELPYTPPDPTPTDGPDIVPDYSVELALVLNDTALVQRLNLLLCAGQLSPETQTFIVNALAIDKVNAGWSDAGQRSHLVRALYFVMCSSEYLVQK